MTKNPAICVSHLGKKYRLGVQQHNTLRDALTNSLKRPAGIFHRDSPKEEFWALKDISFEVDRGEVLGIIGRNGAGKSTLLKILSKITSPTEGAIEIHGRVGSLLEVGTGFHAEMTGRENIFLNGSILGMKKNEIEQKFEDIVKFSEIEKFLDTPVKRYSSGMYVRLAFAVAAHLEPEILIIDEVLAVGDLEFQKKCLGKMGEVAKGGRTVLFVSHNMGAINALCSKVMLLTSGEITYIGPPHEAIAKYTSFGQMMPSVDLRDFHIDRRGEKKYAELISIAVFDKNLVESNLFSMGEPVIIHVRIYVHQPVANPRIGVMLRNKMDSVIHDFTSSFDTPIPFLDPGYHTFEIVVPRIMVYPGTYTLGPWIQTKIGIPSEDYIRAAITIRVEDSQLVGQPEAGFGLVHRDGTEVYIPCTWNKIE